MNILFYFIIAILIGNYFIDLISELLNLKNLKDTIPSEFKGYYDQEKYKKSQHYLKDNTVFGLLQSTLNLQIILGCIVFGVFNILDQFVRSFGFGELITGLLFIGAIFFTAQIISIPFSLYNTFILEEKYGFNTTTYKTFILDLIKSWILLIIIGGLVMAALLWFFNTFGNNAWLIAWLFIVVFQLFMVFITPTLIMPLFNKFKPLETHELIEGIHKLAESKNFPYKGIYEMDGSKRSKKANAFFTGFGKTKRIVFYDTLLKNHTNNEIITVFAHEIGHYKKKHIFKLMTISIMVTGLMLYLLNFAMKNPLLFQAFQMQYLSIYASFVFFSFVFAPIQLVYSILTNRLSRKYEFQADQFAVESTGQGSEFIKALKKLSVDNLSNLTPHSFKVFLEYSHPPVLQRIEVIKSLQSK